MVLQTGSLQLRVTQLLKKEALKPIRILVT